MLFKQNNSNNLAKFISVHLLLNLTFKRSPTKKWQFPPLFSHFPYPMFCIKIKLCIISTKAAAADCRTRKRSRIGPVHVNYDVYFLVLLAHFKICLIFPFSVARGLKIIFETCSVQLTLTCRKNLIPFRQANCNKI